jgi:hypothetical protein
MDLWQPPGVSGSVMGCPAVRTNFKAKLFLAGRDSAGESDSYSAEAQGKKRGAKPKYKFSTEAEAVAMRWALLNLYLMSPVHFPHFGDADEGQE